MDNADLVLMATILEIKTEDEMRTLLADSSDRKVMLFKYSPTCGISLTVQAAWEDWIETAPEELVLAQCDVLAARPAARGINEWLNILHQSPQLLVLKGGKCHAHSSHYSITATWLEQQAK